MLISDNGISRVWRAGEWVYKQQPKYLTDNEIWALQHLFNTGYVPYAEQTAIDTVKIEFIENEKVTNVGEFMGHLHTLLQIFREKGIRHGDLTQYAVRVKNNKPMIIDWGESRTWDDPRPDKRREGDAYWLAKTMKSLCP